MVLPKFQRLICLMLLAAFTASGTSVVPAAVMLIAELDGGHDVWVNESQESTSLTLHHRKGEFTPRVCDHSAPLTRLVVSLCRSDFDGDHHVLASHLATATIHEGNDSERQVSATPILNDQATLGLYTANLWTLSDMNRFNRVRSMSESPNLGQHWALSSVQMLI